MPDSSATDRLIPGSLFSTAKTAAADRFEAWRGSIAALYQAAQLPTAGLAQFSASVKAHHLGQVVGLCCNKHKRQSESCSISAKV